MILCHVMVAECQLTSCWSVVVVGGRVSAERAETGHDDQTEGDQDDLMTHTHTIIMELKFLDEAMVRVAAAVAEFSYDLLCVFMLCDKRNFFKTIFSVVCSISCAAK